MDPSGGPSSSPPVGAHAAAAPAWPRRRLAQPPLLPAPVRPSVWRIAIVLFALAVLVLPIAWTVRFTAQSGWWWERGFDTYNVEVRTGLDRAEVDQAGAALRAYFLNDAERAEISVVNRDGRPEPLFTEREILHMTDVKRLLNRTYYAGWAAIGFIIAFLLGVWYWRRGRARDSLAQAGLYAGGAVLLGIVALSAVAVTGFDGAFRQFHLLFFTNDLWQLSTRERLIQMFPQGFFFETTLLIGGATIAFAAAIALSGWKWRRRPPDTTWAAAGPGRPALSNNAPGSDGTDLNTPGGDLPDADLDAPGHAAPLH